MTAGRDCARGRRAELRSRAQPRGYPSLAVLVLFLGGLQLMALGIIGEYLARMFVEVIDYGVPFWGKSPLSTWLANGVHCAARGERVRGAVSLAAAPARCWHARLATRPIAWRTRLRDLGDRVLVDVGARVSSPTEA